MFCLHVAYGGAGTVRQVSRLGALDGTFCREGASICPGVNIGISCTLILDLFGKGWRDDERQGHRRGLGDSLAARDTGRDLQSLTGGDEQSRTQDLVEHVS